MELLLLLFIPLALGAVFSGGGDDDSDEAPAAAPENGSSANGTDGNDILRGNASDNSLNGGAGDDLVFGYRGDDALNGGPGDDLISGGLDDDTLIGGSGDDLLVGAAVDDSLQGGAGEDLLSGGEGDDTLEGGADDDFLIGSTGADQLYGGAGDDVLEGISPNPSLSLSRGLDEIRAEFIVQARTVFPEVTDADINRFLSDFASEGGAAAPDALYGGAGEDALLGDNGDTLSGGADEDRFAVSWADGNAPVQITDYDTVAGEEILIVIDDATQGTPVLGVRDAAVGPATEILVDSDVVAVLNGIASTQVGLGAIQMQTQSGNGLGISAIRLPAAVA
ncbi:calcium-binding protein [Pseudorhodobacter sp. E13]|uniref:calcium-binding protein n=1 Tax=Pseudorhodobacter sp. E13 TaxID=2487931 RepID=UPI000F8D6BF6|nr:calcium-binding protein [Pseudorhodobacter sp. E13]RUS60987.1 calcium-binding protein [Pseudorhodobacter sp. E13]